MTPSGMFLSVHSYDLLTTSIIGVITNNFMEQNAIGLLKLESNQ